MTDILDDLRRRIDVAAYADAERTLDHLRTLADLSPKARADIGTHAARLVTDIRASARPGLMEVFLAEYGLSTDEGVALMCLAEALLRVPDATTIDALIEDKIAPSDWGRHMGHATSPLVNASTWALMLTGKVLSGSEIPGPVGHLRGAIKRLGEPVIRAAVGRAMREMGAQFVLGESVETALTRARAQEARGYTYSYDMLGEAACTQADADRYFDAYSAAVAAIASRASGADSRANPGVSVKLSALHPRYEDAQAQDVLKHLTPRLHSLCQQAAKANIGLNIDAEEADRLALSLDVIATVAADPALAAWDGFGIVVQAYGQRAAPVIDYLKALADHHNRRFMVRLVKGAYWDTEIKRAQVAGLSGFPVFTSKAATDISYIACARKLLSMTDRLYPQFATHNAHTMAAVLHLAPDRNRFEFQRLHGMGETLHDLVRAQEGTRCRIYAPVGAHRDLLAYLVRRLLENGANSSFVNQIVDDAVPPETVAADPFAAPMTRRIRTGPDLFKPERPNAPGFDLADRPTRAGIEAARRPFRRHRWHARPLLAANAPTGHTTQTATPGDPTDIVGTVTTATAETVRTAATLARPWQTDPQTRTDVLNRAADFYERHIGEFFALLHREAGKTLPDAVAELREAVDFLRYYAARTDGGQPRGVFACISPWNFPLAIFTGQIAAALAAGNAVLAKPAEQTPLIACRAVQMLHDAGVPRDALQLLPGAAEVGAALTGQPHIAGVAFTGSTDPARIIHRNVAEHLDPGAPLIAETGGLNAMIVDSTALPEQAVRAVIESAFQSAGQRCSALRCLYVQDDIAESFLTMLQGAMATLRHGDPWEISTDLGPVIDAGAAARIRSHIARAQTEGRVLQTAQTQELAIAPTLIRVSGIDALEQEIFGPVLHVATFAAQDIDRVIDAINARGYGLTFGLQTRIDERVTRAAKRIQAGNVYVNRNQIGAIVGSQPFGGEGLSGTGPKAGGPLYVDRFRRHPAPSATSDWLKPDGVHRIQPALHTAKGGAPDRTDLPGPTGEANQYTTHTRPPVLCLGPGPETAAAQVRAIQALGGAAVAAQGSIAPKDLIALQGMSAVLWWGDAATACGLRKALAARDGPILPLITDQPDRAHARAERHICIDTTASGGNTALLSGED